MRDFIKRYQKTITFALVVLLVFAFPILLHVISWVLYLNATKSKTDKFAFRIAWIIQALVTVITMVIALVNVFKG